MPSKGAAGIAGVAVAALLAFAPSASALQTVSVKGVDQGDGVFIGTATCPPGKTVVSGGFEAAVDAYASVNRAKGDRRWVAQVLETDSLTVTAQCSKRLDPSVSSATTEFPTGTEGVNRTARARCRRGKVVAGGWRYRPAGLSVDNSPVFKSKPKGGDRWLVTATHDGPDGDDTITAYAYCLRGVGVRARSKDVEIESDQGKTVTRSCRSREELLGGGFSIRPRPDWNNKAGPDPFYYASHRSGSRSWLASAQNYSSVEGTLTAFAMCRT